MILDKCVFDFFVLYFVFTLSLKKKRFTSNSNRFRIVRVRFTRRVALLVTRRATRRACYPACYPASYPACYPACYLTIMAGKRRLDYGREPGNQQGNKPGNRSVE